MDTYELMTNLRNITKKHTEKDLPSAELLRCLNLANGMVSQLCYPLFKEDLVKILTESSQSGNYDLPKDILLMVNAYRKNASSAYKLCNKIEIERKPIIGTPQLPSDENYPLYVQLGRAIEFTPILSSTDIKLEYRKRIAELIWGIGTSAADGSYITLDNYAPVRDDVLNDYWLALYKNVSGDLRKVDVVKISDYTASTKQATCTCPDNDQEYTYALVPILPDEFHNFLVEGALSYLAKSNYYAGDAFAMKKELKDDIALTLQLHGLEYNPKNEGK